jgi:DNA-directed RNA polymerase subunit RPC12/RpoP
MAATALEGHFNRSVDLDVCHPCQLIWFDHFENLALAPGGTLKMFQMIGGEPRRPTAATPRAMKCPRCNARLLSTHDRQRNTPFHYWRCPADHGRLITYFDFLREKNFIRLLTPPQLAELRRNIQQINCANCSAPIDLMHASACGHCGAPIATLDLQQIGEVAEQLQRADARAKAPPDYEAVYAALRQRPARDRHEAPDIVAVALGLVADWLI